VDVVIGQHLLGQSLVARDHQAARIAAGVFLFAQLEVARDVLVGIGNLRQPLDHVEDDVRL
jgi:hypothetical protein